jgi:hypothetical protein
MSHIKDTATEVAWCNVELKEEFYFKDIEQAAINGKHGNRPMCADCVNAIIECLELRATRQLEYEGSTYEKS